MAMVFFEEPIVSRLDRLDVMLKQLEEIKGYNKSPRSSYASSTPSSCKTHVSDEGGGTRTTSVDSSPKKHCRPIDTVMIETEIKGNIIDRIHQVEDRLLKVCIDLESQERQKIQEYHIDEDNKDKIKKEHNKKGLMKQFVKSCVKGKPSKHKK